MRIGKSLVGFIVLVLASMSIWAPVRANYKSLFFEEAKDMSNATITNAQSDKGAADRKKSGQESPFTCNMLALDVEGRRRHKTVMEQMRAATNEVKVLPDGYAFRFAADQPTILLVSEFIARERLCCPFFTFEMVAEQEDGPLWLRLRGRKGVKKFIEAEMGIK